AGRETGSGGARRRSGNRAATRQSWACPGTAADRLVDGVRAARSGRRRAHRGAYDIPPLTSKFVTSTPVQNEPPAENSVSLRLANGPLSGPVLCRVVSMVLVRADCPMDRLDDAMILCDALSAHAPAHANDRH